jgi:hypothetical protein
MASRRRRFFLQVVGYEASGTPNGRAPAAETACSEGNLGVGHQARARAGTMIAVSLPAPYLGHHANLGSSHHVGGQFPSRRHYEHPRIYVRGRLS